MTGTESGPEKDEMNGANVDSAIGTTTSSQREPSTSPAKHADGGRDDIADNTGETRAGVTKENEAPINRKSSESNDLRAIMEKGVVEFVPAAFSEDVVDAGMAGTGPDTEGYDLSNEYMNSSESSKNSMLPLDDNNTLAATTEGEGDSPGQRRRSSRGSNSVDKGTNGTGSASKNTKNGPTRGRGSASSNKSELNTSGTSKKGNSSRGGGPTTIGASSFGLVNVGSSNKKSAKDILAEELDFLHTVNSSSTKAHGKKKTTISLDHLVNFQLPPRQTDHNNNYSSYKTKNRGNISSASIKERFVNANYKFVMKSDGDYSINLFDPDLAVNWQDIIQVLVPTTKIPTCPICLSPPNAPQVAKCGHIFCWPCILHYIAVGEDKKKWRKCPICYETIHQNDLKPTKFNLMDDLSLVSPTNPIDIKMVLMKCRMKCAVSLPRSIYGRWASSSGSNIQSPKPPSVISKDTVPYSKILLSSPEYVKEEILLKEKHKMEDLQQQALTEKTLVELGEIGVNDSSSELPFIDMALTNINEKLLELAPELESMNDYSKLYPQNENDTQEKTSNLIESIEKANSSIPNEPKSADYCFFYQAMNGQNVFLHPLDIKILKYEFGEYYKFPEMIDTTIQLMQETTVTEDLRKRFRSLAHLPLSCDVSLIQIDLEKLVSPETLEYFSHDLRSRARKQKELDLKAERESQKTKEKIERQLQDELLRSGSELNYSGADNVLLDTLMPTSDLGSEHGGSTLSDDFGKGMTLSEFLESDVVKNSTKKNKKKKGGKQGKTPNLYVTSDGLVDEEELQIRAAQEMSLVANQVNSAPVGRRRINKKLFKTGNSLYDERLLKATLDGSNVDRNIIVTDGTTRNYYDIESASGGQLDDNYREHTYHLRAGPDTLPGNDLLSASTSNDECYSHDGNSGILSDTISVTSGETGTSYNGGTYSIRQHSSERPTSGDVQYGHDDHRRSSSRTGVSPTPHSRSIPSSPPNAGSGFSFVKVARGVQKPSSNVSSLSTSPSMWPTLDSATPADITGTDLPPSRKNVKPGWGNNSNSNNSSQRTGSTGHSGNRPSLTTSTGSIVDPREDYSPRPFDPFATAFSALVEEALPANGIANPLVASATAGETSMMLLSSAQRKKLAKQRNKERRDRMFGSVSAAAAKNHSVPPAAADPAAIRGSAGGNQR